jgi:hypothetical protein
MPKEPTALARRTTEEMDRLRRSLLGFIDLLAGSVAERLRKNQTMRPRPRRSSKPTSQTPDTARQPP